MIEPKPPPVADAAHLVEDRSSFSLVAPPEKITMRRPSKAHCTTWRTRSARVAIGILAFS